MLNSEVASDTTLRALVNELMEGDEQQTPRDQLPTEPQTKDGFPIVQATNTPYIMWTDSDYQYVVNNPNNHGDVLLKLEVCKGIRPINRCDMFLSTTSDEDNDVVDTLTQLMSKLKNHWTDGRGVGGKKGTASVYRSATLLSTWRTVGKERVFRKLYIIDGTYELKFKRTLKT